MSEEFDNPHTSEATLNTPNPTAKTSRLPNMSPKTPAVSKKAARVSE